MKDDLLIEGLYADDYDNSRIKDIILNSYQERYKQTPSTHPEKFNPLDPPIGWKYDPYYECWIKL